MTAETFVIRDAQEFEKCRVKVTTHFDVRRRLPERVFSEAFRCFAFEEFDWLMSREGWPSIQELGFASADKSILIAVLDPDPREYFRKQYSVFNWAQIPTSAESDRYWDTINEAPGGNAADSIWGNSEVVVWLPGSGKWAIWGERAYGICILATQEAELLTVASSWRSADAMLSSVLPNSFSTRTVPPDFRAAFLSNFKGNPGYP